MRRRTFYLLTIVIGVFCATLFLYYSTEPGHTASCASKQKETGNVAVFPEPGRTVYKMQLYLDAANAMLYGQTDITTVNSSGRKLTQLWFTAYPNAFRDAAQTPAPASAYYNGFDPGWLQVQKLTVNNYPAAVDGEGVACQADLSHSVLPGKEMKIAIQWKVRIPQTAYRFGSSRGVYMLGDFYPALNRLDAAGWHNPVNSRWGDPFCFSCADYQVEVNIPAGYQMVSTGINQDTISEDDGRETHIIEARNARDFCMALMNGYAELAAGNGHTRIKCLVPADYTSIAGEVLTRSRQIFNYYSSTFGPYPYSEFNIVFVPMMGFDGMEYSGLVFLGDKYLQPGQSQDASEFLLAHEIAHQWWYGAVGNDQIKEPWLDEALANWSAYKYLQECEGRLPPEAAAGNSENLNRGLQQFSSSQDYYLTVYTGGEAFWFGLEKELGTNQVKKILKSYYSKYRFDIATTADLKRCIQFEAGKNLQYYFNRWFKE